MFPIEFRVLAVPVFLNEYFVFVFQLHHRPILFYIHCWLNSVTSLQVLMQLIYLRTKYAKQMSVVTCAAWISVQFQFNPSSVSLPHINYALKRALLSQLVCTCNVCGSCKQFGSPGGSYWLNSVTSLEVLTQCILVWHERHTRQRYWTWIQPGCWVLRASFVAVPMFGLNSMSRYWLKSVSLFGLRYITTYISYYSLHSAWNQ